jgi:hypothetical protein
MRRHQHDVLVRVSTHQAHVMQMKISSNDACFCTSYSSYDDRWLIKLLSLLGILKHKQICCVTFYDTGPGIFRNAVFKLYDVVASRSQRLQMTTVLKFVAREITR